jgi:hypothetical protein
MFLVAISHTPNVQWQLNFFNPQEKGACKMFLKRWHKLALCGDQKFQLA